MVNAAKAFKSALDNVNYISFKSVLDYKKLNFNLILNKEW